MTQKLSDPEKIIFFAAALIMKNKHVESIEIIKLTETPGYELRAHFDNDTKRYAHRVLMIDLRSTMLGYDLSSYLAYTFNMGIAKYFDGLKEMEKK